MTKSTITQAIARYARRHGYSARTVRVVTTLRQCAVHEWLDRGSRWVVGRTADGRPTLPEQVSS